MKNSFLSKKIPTIIGIFLIIGGIFGGYYLVKEKKVFISQVQTEKAPTQMITTPDESPSLNAITIDNPAKEGEKINTLKPLFQGTGPPNKILTITIESMEPYTTDITVNEDGIWNFLPPFELSPGDHTLTIDYTEESGEEKTISKNFVILTGGESDLPAIIATPSGELASPSPLPSPSASPRPEDDLALPEITRVTQPTTDGSMPATGISLPTILIFLAGIILVTIGFVFP